ncbi:MAG: ribbon-helix-helix domain-containing protein [Pseudomonadota bacterium]
MAKAKVAATLDTTLLNRLNALVKEGRFSNRSAAIETALEEKLDRLTYARLAHECAKLDPSEECALAEEGFNHTGIETWPKY